MNEQFQKKIVFISGAGHGLGRVLAQAFGVNGAIVAVNDINPDRAAKTVSWIKEKGGYAKAYLADVSKKIPVQLIFNQIEDDWSGLDIVVNNAAVRPQKPLIDMDEWEWRRVLDVNLTGPFLVTQVAARLMRSFNRGGVIINIGCKSKEFSFGEGFGAYSAAKSALISLTKTASEELLEYGIQVFAICPGKLSGEMDFKSPVSPGIPEKTPFSTREVVQTALFLSSHPFLENPSQIFGE